MICVIATIEVIPGQRQAFLDQFRQIVPKVLQEPGCQEYVPMIDVPTSIGPQTPAHRDVITVVEKWTSVDALDAHLIAPHMVEYRKAVKDLVKSVSLRILTPA